MNNENFLEQMNRKKSIKVPEGIKKLSAADYFETEAGKEMLDFIAAKAVISERKFKIVEVGAIQMIHAHPLYKGRDFLQDMKDLNFNVCTNVRQIDGITVVTYTFEC